MLKLRQLSQAVYVGQCGCLGRSETKLTGRADPDLREEGTEGVRGAFRQSAQRSGASGRCVCNDNHDNDRRRARNGEADTVDVRC